LGLHLYYNVCWIAQTVLFISLKLGTLVGLDIVSRYIEVIIPCLSYQARCDRTRTVRVR